MECKDLKFTRKSTKSYEIKFTKDGSAEDITGYTIYFTIKENVEDTDVNAKLTKTITSLPNALSGKVLIELTTADTDIVAGNYWYSIDFKDPDGNEGVLFSGKIKIEEPLLKTRG